RDAERAELRPARLDDSLRLLEHGALDTAVADGARHLAGPRDGHLRAERPRARAPGFHDRAEGDLLARRVPFPQLGCDLSHRFTLLSREPSKRPSSSSDSRLLAARKSSTSGSAAAMPRVTGSYPSVPFSGLSQISRCAERCSRPSSRRSSVGSPRSQPSETTITTAPWPSIRRAQRWLNSRSASPMRVPPLKSWTERVT